MRITVNGGHSKKSQGASGYLNEVTADRAIKDALIKELRSRGHVVTDSTSDADTASAVLMDQVAKANASRAHFGISIHLNAGGGTGTEVYYWADDAIGQSRAARTSKAVASVLGLKDRGAKPTRTLYWVRHTNMRSILVEVCFVDSQKDATAYNEHGAAAVARAIADMV